MLSIPSQTLTLTVLNLKGGVGKTHAAWLLASVAQERQSRTLLVDTDAQGNLTSSFLATDAGTPGVEQLFDPSAESDAAPLIRETQYPHIDIIPSGPALAPFDLASKAEWEDGDLHLSLIESLRDVADQYDLIIIDCPPRLSLVSIAALCCSDGLIIPMEAADWGAQGIMQVTDVANFVQHAHNPDLALLGYVVSRFKTRRAYQQSYMTELREHFGPLAFDTVVPDLARFEKSVTDRIPITLHAPKSREATIARAFFDEV